MSDAEARERVGAAAWPKGVRSIDWKSMARLGVSDDGLLYWDGKPIELRQRLALTWWQKIVALLTALAIIVGGLGGLAQGIDAGHNFGCKIHWWTRGCSK